MDSKRTEELKRALQADKDKQSFFCDRNVPLDPGVLRIMLEAHVEMSRLLDQLIPDRSDDV